VSAIISLTKGLIYGSLSTLSYALKIRFRGIKWFNYFIDDVKLHTLNI